MGTACAPPTESRGASAHLGRFGSSSRGNGGAPRPGSFPLGSAAPPRAARAPSRAGARAATFADLGHCHRPSRPPATGHRPSVRLATCDCAGRTAGAPFFSGTKVATWCVPESPGASAHFAMPSTRSLCTACCVGALPSKKCSSLLTRRYATASSSLHLGSSAAQGARCTRAPPGRALHLAQGPPRPVLPTPPESAAPATPHGRTAASHWALSGAAARPEREFNRQGGQAVRRPGSLGLRLCQDGALRTVPTGGSA